MSFKSWILDKEELLEIFIESILRGITNIPWEQELDLYKKYERWVVNKNDKAASAEFFGAYIPIAKQMLVGSGIQPDEADNLVQDSFFRLLKTNPMIFEPEKTDRDKTNMFFGGLLHKIFSQLILNSRRGRSKSTSIRQMPEKANIDDLGLTQQGPGYYKSSDKLRKGRSKSDVGAGLGTTLTTQEKEGEPEFSARPKDVTKAIEDLASGVCPTCKGNGRSTDGRRPCGKCSGTGNSERRMLAGLILKLIGIYQPSGMTRGHVPNIIEPLTRTILQDKKSDGSPVYPKEYSILKNKIQQRKQMFDELRQGTTILQRVVDELKKQIGEDLPLFKQTEEDEQNIKHYETLLEWSKKLDREIPDWQTKLDNKQLRNALGLPKILFDMEKAKQIRMEAFAELKQKLG